jgi:hypothetical protein
MIKITCETGDLRRIKVVDQETGQDLSKYLTDVKIFVDPKFNCLRATLELARVDIDINLKPEQVGIFKQTE